MRPAQQRARGGAEDDERDGRGAPQGSLGAGCSQPGVRRETGEGGGDDHGGDVLHGEVPGRRRLRAHGQGE